MPILDTYYQLIERDKRHVSCWWKAMHISALLTAAISGLISAIFFCLILNGFSNNCILHPSISFSTALYPDAAYTYFPKNMTINIRQTIWSPDLMCQFCVMSWMLGFIIATIASIVYIVTSKGGKSEEEDVVTEPWKLMYPSVVISLVFSLVNGVSAYACVHGFRKFCEEFEIVTDQNRCNSIIDVYTKLFTGRQYYISVFIQIVNVCAVVALCAWMFFLITLVTRICIAPDFKLLIIHIKSCEHVFQQQQQYEQQIEPKRLSEILSESKYELRESAVDDKRSFVEIGTL